MIVDAETVDWLVWLGLPKNSFSDPQQPEILHPQFVEGLFTGQAFASVSLGLCENLELPLEKEQRLQHILEGSTEEQRAHNYDILFEFWADLGYELDSNVKEALLLRDEQTCTDLLLDLARLFPPDTSIGGQGPDLRRATPRVDENSVLIGNTTMAVAHPGVEKAFTKQDIQSLNFNHLDKQSDLTESISIPEILIATLSRGFNIKIIEAASLFTENNRYLALIIAKGYRGEFEPVIDWFREVTDIKEHLIELALIDDTGDSLRKILEIFKPGVVSRDTEVARYACRLFSNFSYCLLDKGALSMAYDWAVSPRSLMTILVMGLKRHISLVEEVVTVMLDFASNRIAPFFERDLPELLQNDIEYFKFLNTIFESLMAREQIRREVGESGLFQSWCQLAITFTLNPDLDPLLKTDFLNYLKLAWKFFPNLFEEDRAMLGKYLEHLYKAVSSSSIVESSVAMEILFELLAFFSELRRPWAPDIFKRLIDSFIGGYASLELRTSFIKHFMDLFVSVDIPAEILMDGYLRFLQKPGDDMEMGVEDLEFLKFLVSKKDLSHKHKLAFFDLFCKIFLQNLILASGVIDNIFDLASVLINQEDGRNLVFKFVEVIYRFYFQTYIKRKVVIGHTDIQQTIQAHKRGLCVQLLNLMAGLDPELSNSIRVLALNTFMDIEKHFKAGRKKDVKNKGTIGGLRKIIENFGQFDELMTQHLVDTGVIAQLNKSQQESSIDEGHIKDMSGIVEGLDLDLSMVLEEQGSLSKLKPGQVGRSGSQKKGKKPIKRIPTKHELYEKLRAKGVVDDPKQVARLAKFKESYKSSMRAANEQHNQSMMKQEREYNFLKKHLNKRRIQLGIEKRGDHKDGESDQLIYPLDAYQKQIDRFEDRSGVETVSLFDFSQMDDIEYRAVKTSFSKYKKLWSHIFTVYSNCINTFEKRTDFEKINSQLSRISRPEFYKFVKDYRFEHLITQLEIKTLFKLLSVQVLKKDDGTYFFLDQTGFRKLILQVSLLMYSRGEGNLAGYPASFCIEAFVKHITQIFEQTGRETDFFMNPDKFNVQGDPEVIEYLNEQAKEDPEFELPLTYKKIESDNYSYELDFPRGLDLPEGFSVCYGLLNDLLEESLGVSLKQHSYSIQDKGIRIQPKTFKELDKEVNIRQKDAHMKKRDLNVDISEILYPRERHNTHEFHVVKPCLELKVAVEYEPYEDRPLAVECSKILEEMLAGAASNNPDLDLHAGFKNRRFENEAVLRSQAFQEQSEAKRSFDLYKSLRSRTLKLTLKEHKLIQDKNQKAYEILRKKEEDNEDKSPSEKKEIETSSLKTLRKIKKKPITKLYLPKNVYTRGQATPLASEDFQKQVELIQKRKEKQKKKVDKYRDQIRESKEKLKTEREQKQEEEYKQRVEQTIKYGKKRRKELKKEFQGVVDVRKKEMAFYKTYNTLTKELKETNEQYVARWKKHRKKLIEEKKQIGELLNFILLDPIYEDFKSFHKDQNKALFEFYINLMEREEKLKWKDKQIQLPERLFLKFLVDFNIVPVLTNPRDMITLFKKVNTGRKGYSKLDIMGLTLEEFVNLIVQMTLDERIQEILNKMFATAYKNIINQKLEEIRPIRELTKEQRRRMNEEEYFRYKLARERHIKRNKLKERRNFIRQIVDTEFAPLEGYMVYLKLPQDTLLMAKTVQEHNDEKTLPNRILVETKLKMIKMRQDHMLRSQRSLDISAGKLKRKKKSRIEEPTYDTIDKQLVGEEGEASDVKDSIQNEGEGSDVKDGEATGKKEEEFSPNNSKSKKSENSEQQNVEEQPKKDINDDKNSTLLKQQLLT